MKNDICQNYLCLNSLKGQKLVFYSFYCCAISIYFTMIITGYIFHSLSLTSLLAFLQTFKIFLVFNLNVGMWGQVTHCQGNLLFFTLDYQTHVESQSAFWKNNKYKQIFILKAKCKHKQNRNLIMYGFPLGRTNQHELLNDATSALIKAITSPTS